MATQDLVLPELRPKAVGPTIPKRYEETRPAVLQGFVHRKILGMGQDVYQHVLKQCHKEKVYAIRSTEELVWSEAEVLKDEAVEKALKKAKAEHEKLIRKINRAHERVLKEELICLSNKMDQQRMEEIEKTKQEGEKALQLAVQQTEQLWQKKLIQAVEAARCEERKIAVEKAAQVAVKHKEELSSLQKKMTKERLDALEALTEKKDKETVVAVATAREEEQQVAQKKMAHFRNLYDQQVTVLQTHIRERNYEISALKQHISEINDDGDQVKNELAETRKEFQCFIDIVRPFNKSESRYLIPPSKTIDVDDYVDERDQDSS